MSGDVERLAEVRFLTKIDRQDSCWLWTGTLYRDGYGQFSDEGKKVRAHRWAYEHWVAAIPEGLVLDHLCRVRACVNPAHLEPVTNQENLRRGMPIQCPSGHLFTPENTRINPSGHRVCRECHRRTQAKRSARKFTCPTCGRQCSLSQRGAHMRIHQEPSHVA